MHGRFVMIVAIVAALVGGACSTGGVSQELYDQKIEELRVIHQDLERVTNESATNQAAAVSALASVEAAQRRADEAQAAVEALHDEIRKAVASTGLVVTSQEDALELATSALIDSQEEVRRLEGLLESSEGEAESLSIDRLDAFLTIAATTKTWLRTDLVPGFEELAVLADPVSRAADEMLTLSYENLLTEYETVDAVGKRELLSDVASWAIGMAQSELARTG